LITIRSYDNIENLDNINYEINNNNLNKLLINSNINDISILPIQNIDTTYKTLNNINILKGLNLINKNKYFSIEITEYYKFINKDNIFKNISENDLLNIILQILKIYKLLNSHFKNKLLDVSLNDFKIWKNKNNYEVKLFNFKNMKLNKDNFNNNEFLDNILLDIKKLVNNDNLYNKVIKNKEISLYIDSNKSENIDMEGGGKILKGHRKINKYETKNEIDTSDDSDGSENSRYKKKKKNIKKIKKKNILKKEIVKK
jgi:hypothetical protein